MKIIDRKTFLQMPKGTVYCKFPRYNKENRSYKGYPFGISEPYIKMNHPEDGWGQDFEAMGIGSSFYPVGATNSNDYFDTLGNMEANLGKEVAFGYYFGRDGCFESEEDVGFVIFSSSEVKLMIKELQEALNTAYSAENLDKLHSRQQRQLIDGDGDNR